MTTNECVEYKIIPEFSVYEINNLGQIRNRKTKKLLKPDLAKRSYFHVKLKCELTNKHKTMYIHRLVYQTFIGQIPKGMTINHKDSNKLNNDVNNLEVLSNEENIRLGVKNKKGYTTHNKKVKNQIRSLYRKGVPGCGYESLSILFGIHHSTVRRIING